jgi:hypothetical protein
MGADLLLFASARAFFGAPLYVNVVEQTARLALDARAIVREWAFEQSAWLHHALVAGNSLRVFRLSRVYSHPRCALAHGRDDRARKLADQFFIDDRAGGSADRPTPN